MGTLGPHLPLYHPLFPYLQRFLFKLCRFSFPDNFHLLNHFSLILRFPSWLGLISPRLHDGLSQLTWGMDGVSLIEDAPSKRLNSKLLGVWQLKLMSPFSIPIAGHCREPVRPGPQVLNHVSQDTQNSRTQRLRSACLEEDHALSCPPALDREDKPDGETVKSMVRQHQQCPLRTREQLPKNPQRPAAQLSKTHGSMVFSRLASSAFIELRTSGKLLHLSAAWFHPHL